MPLVVKMRSLEPTVDQGSYIKPQCFFLAFFGSCHVSASANEVMGLPGLYDADADEKVPAEDIVPSEDIGSDGSTPSLVQ